MTQARTLVVEDDVIAAERLRDKKKRERWLDTTLLHAKRPTPIIALTAGAFEEERAEALSAGCDDYVHKPFKETEIFEVMAQHLGVRYVYEESGQAIADKDRADKDRLDKEERGLPLDALRSTLHNLPADWIAKLRQAATEGEAEQIVDLLEQIEPGHPALAQVLAALVRGYRFGEIVALTQPGEDEDYY